MAKPSAELTRELQESIRRCLSRGAVHQQHRVKLETKPKKYEDRVLLHPSFPPSQVESSFNVLEIRTFSTLNQNQILVETERGTVSMRLPSAESVEQVTRHVSTALAKVCPGPGCLIRRGNPETPEGPRDTSPNSETSTSTTHSVCGGFSETYAALCDYNGLHCREEVQWPLGEPGSGPDGGSSRLQPVVYQTPLQGSTGSGTGATHPEQVGEPRRAGARQCWPQDVSLWRLGAASSKQEHSQSSNSRTVECGIWRGLSSGGAAPSHFTNEETKPQGG
uniref:Capping protein regulator and myosin 1 linker 3 n=1 Tax=Monodelphis domestica TaxID=13616 RepID=F7FAM7_MONDO